MKATDEQLDRFNQEGGGGAKIDTCEKCGLTTDCVHDGVYLCVEHAVEEWYDELQTKVDPADQGYKVVYDVRAHDELEGFTATWFNGAFEGFVSIEELKEIRKELMRTVKNEEKVLFVDMSKEDQATIRRAIPKGEVEWFSASRNEWLEDYSKTLEDYEYLPYRTKELKR